MTRKKLSGQPNTLQTSMIEIEEIKLLGIRFAKLHYQRENVKTLARG